MPLNVQNKTFVTVNDESKLPSTPQLPKKRLISIKYFLIGLSIVIVVSSAVFLIYIFSLKRLELSQGAQEMPSAQVVQSPEIKTKAETSAAQPIQTTTKIETPPAKPTPIIPGQSSYTIYIAAYTTNTPALEEVSRWNEAGYVASVNKSNEHFNVALGRYATIAEAHAFAEEMFDAFENGYFIGKIK